MKLLLCFLGLLIGSFLNVCIYRIPRGESVTFTPSHCPNCNTSLKPAELVPVLSYIFQRGRCKTCKMKISIQYPLIELLNAILYVLLYSIYGNSCAAYIFCLSASALIVLSMIDLETQTIPDRFHLIIGFLAICSLIIHRNTSVSSSAIAGFLVAGGFFLLLAVVTGGGMGGGDIKLMAALGLLFGFKGILVVTLLSFVLGAVISVILMVTKIKKRKDFIPFGPFIAISGLLVMIFGDTLQSWLLLF